jgi:hypothetical protein
LNLFQPIQTYPCLGHCITRGIGLRRQAKIFRSAAQRFLGVTETVAFGEPRKPDIGGPRLKPLTWLRVSCDTRFSKFAPFLERGRDIAGSPSRTFRSPGGSLDQISFSCIF